MILAIRAGMNWDTIKGQWKMLKGDARQRWGQLTDEDWQRAAGDREQLEGAIQKRYGMEKDKAKREVDEWVAKLKNRIAGQPRP